jgi:hypothetical protein
LPLEFYLCPEFLQRWIKLLIYEILLSLMLRQSQALIIFWVVESLAALPMGRADVLFIHPMLLKLISIHFAQVVLTFCPPDAITGDLFYLPPERNEQVLFKLSGAWVDGNRCEEWG